MESKVKCRKMSVGKISFLCRRNVGKRVGKESVGKLNVGKVSAGKISVGKVSICNV